MSAREAVVAGIVAQLQGDPALAALRVFDGVPVRAAYPYAIVEEPALEARDLAGLAGRVGTVAIACRDGGERPERLRALLGAIEDAVAGLPTELGDGWRLAELRLQASRLTRGKEEWLARSVWAVRVYRTEG